MKGAKSILKRKQTKSPIYVVTKDENKFKKRIAQGMLFGSFCQYNMCIRWCDDDLFSGALWRARAKNVSVVFLHLRPKCLRLGNSRNNGFSAVPPQCADIQSQTDTHTHTRKYKICLWRV